MDVIVDEIAGKSFRRSETVDCPLCGTAHTPRRISARFGMTAMVADCAECRIAYQTPRPSRDACIAYMDWRWGMSDKYVTDNKEKRRKALIQLLTVNSQHEGPPARLLDLGAGSGAFVRAALDAGWDAIGVEHSSSAILRAKECYNVHLVDKIPAGPFDIVTLWDVIEHLKGPVSTLSQLYELLRPGGSIILETGNYESWERVAQGEKWGLYLLDHHYYFSPASLEAVLKRARLSEFRLLPSKRSRPSIWRKPLRLRQWITWHQCRSMWPDHSEISVMIAAARKPTDLSEVDKS
jgi:2-polyprenyl-3-methyl-5-hydroxy-6-metoxy-1,4-benzoquinol methylase